MSGHLEKELQSLVDRGLTFGDCVQAFGERSGIVDAAREMYQREGEVEIDETAVVSRGGDNGAYVMAWVWVDGEELEED